MHKAVATAEKIADLSKLAVGIAKEAVNTGTALSCIGIC